MLWCKYDKYEYHNMTICKENFNIHMGYKAFTKEKGEKYLLQFT